MRITRYETPLISSLGKTLFVFVFVAGLFSVRGGGGGAWPRPPLLLIGRRGGTDGGERRGGIT